MNKIHNCILLVLFFVLWLPAGSMGQCYDVVLSYDDMDNITSNVTVNKLPEESIIFRADTANAIADTFAYTYQWSKDGEVIPGATSSVYEISSLEEEDSGEYLATFTITTNCNVCTDTGDNCTVASQFSITLSVEPEVIAITADPDTILNCQTTSIELRTNAPSGSEFEWMGPGVNGTMTSRIFAETAGTYSVEIMLPDNSVVEDEIIILDQSFEPTADAGTDVSLTQL